MTTQELAALKSLLSRIADQVAPTLAEPLEVIDRHDYLELRAWIAALAREITR